MKIGSSGVYLDTSALAKLYLPEAESDELEASLLGRTDLMVSDLAVTELTSALARRVREKLITAHDARLVYREVLRDLSGGQFQRLQLEAAAHREAERLLTTLGQQTALRAADALHIAMAVFADAQALVTFDQHMRSAALAMGTLEVVG